jgi:hypothetical protein
MQRIPFHFMLGKCKTFRFVQQECLTPVYAGEGAHTFGVLQQGLPPDLRSVVFFLFAYNIQAPKGLYKSTLSTKII